MQEEFGPKGLVVVGVTNEPESLVTKHIDKKKMNFPVAIVGGDDFDRAYGVRAFPSSFLIGPDGTVEWAGHPGNFPEDVLEKLLEKLDLPPELNGDYADIRENLAARKYGKAWKAVERDLAKNPEDAQLKAASEFLGKGVTDRLAAAEAAIGEGQYGKARRLYDELLGPWSDVPGADAAKAALAELKKNKDAKNELAASDKLDDAIALFRKGELEKAAKSFAVIAKKYPETPSGKRAEVVAELHPLD
jgi:thioredoxin-like negative regulator of GroEL